MKFIDLSGQIFGKLTVVSRSAPCRSGASWTCVCECGKTTIVSACHLRQGHTKSCGCHKAKILKDGVNKTHGMANKTPTYKTWKEMRNRCRNPNAQNWKWYGGNGISICERWNDYQNFLADMGERPLGTSIDRIDVLGNYEPNNCRWATSKEQAESNRGCKRKGASPANKISQEKILAMREMRLSGAKIREIAQHFGHNQSNICEWILRGN